MNNEERIKIFDTVKELQDRDKRIAELKEENKRLKEEYVMLQNASDSVEEDLQEENKQLKEEIKGLKNLYENMGIAFNNAEQRIDKAIEYIEKHISYECDDVINGMRFCSYHLIYDFRKEDLLEILKGDSNE